MVTKHKKSYMTLRDEVKPQEGLTDPSYNISMTVFEAVISYEISVADYGRYLEEGSDPYKSE
jgi:hypothetical protein